MTRITRAILANNLIANLRRNFERLERLQRQLSSGLEVEKPSDAPLRARRVLLTLRETRELGRFEQTIDDTTKVQLRVGQALQDARNLLNEVRTITLQGANDPSSSPRDTLVVRMTDLINDLVDTANTTVGGKFIFAGSETETSPFQIDSKTNPQAVTYLGDTHQRKRKVSSLLEVDEGFVGTDIFGVRSHTVTAGRAVTNTDAPLSVALGSAFTATETLRIRMGNATTATDVNIDFTATPQASLEDVRDAILAANAGVSAAINDRGQLVITSDVEGEEGRFTLQQTAGTLFSTLQLVDNNGVFLGTEASDPDIFDELISVREALNGRAFQQDLLLDLIRQSNGNNLGLQIGDQITITADAGSGPTANTFTVSNKSTLQDLLAEIQNTIRTAGGAGSETAIVRVRHGQIEVINPNGTNANAITALTVDTALNPQGARPEFDAFFDAIDSSVAGTPFPVAVGTRINTGILSTSKVADNVNRRLPRVQEQIDAIANRQNQIGNRTQQLERMKDRHAQSKIKLEEILSDTRDVDMAKAIVELRRQESVFQGALGAGARVIQPTLLDFLR